MKKLNIAILNAEAGGNKGAEAMLETLIRLLSKKYKNSNLYLEVGNNTSYYSNVFLPRFEGVSIELLEFRPKKMLKPFGTKLNDIDIAIDIGGINFVGNSKKAILRSLVRYFPFISRNKPLIFFTQDLGPSNNFFALKLGQFVLSRSKAFFTRSERSHKEALNSFKLVPEKVFGPYPDSTLLFNASATKSSNTSNVSERNSIVLSPSAIMYKRHGDSYLKLFEDLYKHFNANYKVIILVHNFTKNFGNSDVDICSRIYKKCPDSVLINENISTGELKTQIAEANLVISSRYHVVVGAVSQNVPAFAIGWNPKYNSFLKLYQKEEWNLDFNDANTFDEILKLTKTNLDRDGLKQANYELKKSVELSFEELYGVIARNLDNLKN